MKYLILLLLFSNPVMAQTITNHGGKVISNPQYHLIFEGKYDLVLQAQLTMFVKDYAPNPDSTVLEYDSGAKGTLVSTANGPASMTVGTSQTQTDVDTVVGKLSSIARFYLLFNDRITGNANDVYIICCAPGAKPIEWGYHWYLTHRKGVVIVCTYSDINSMTYGISHEIDECLVDPLCGNGGWYGSSTNQEVCDICNGSDATKQVTINEDTYTVAKVFNEKDGKCE